MNIYDTKSVYCYECGKFLGEIDCDATVTMPQCGSCVNRLSEEDLETSFQSYQEKNSEIIIAS